MEGIFQFRSIKITKTKEILIIYEIINLIMQTKLLIYMKKIINKFKLKEETTTHTNIIIMIKL